MPYIETFYTLSDIIIWRPWSLETDSCVSATRMYIAGLMYAQVLLQAHAKQLQEVSDVKLGDFLNSSICTDICQVCAVGIPSC